jgi:hypothetical protein
MMKNAFILLLVIIGISCSTPKKAPASRDIQPMEATTYDTIKIVNEELEYEIIIFEIGFDSWLVTQFPPSYYSNETLAVRNYMMVVEWNIRVMEPLRYDPLLYEQLIDYKPNIDYGMEVNYVLYMYFKYFQKKYNQRLGSYQP